MLSLLPRRSRPRAIGLRWLLLGGILCALVGLVVLIALFVRPVAARDYLARGDALAAEYSFRGAIVSYEQARTLEPNNPEIALRLARVHRAKGDFAAADGELATALAAPAARGAALVEAGDLAQARGNPAGARAHWLEARGESPADPAPLARLATLAIQNREFAAARAYLEDDIARRPAAAATRYQLALVTALDDPAAAQAHLAAVETPRPALLASRIATLESGLDQARRATGAAEAAVWLGQAFLEAGEIGFAETVFERALAADPQLLAARGRLAFVLTQTGEFGRAEHLAARVREAEPDNGLAWVTLGIAQRGQGNLAAARATFEEGERRFPTDPLFPAELGSTLLALGDGLGAEPKLNRAVDLAPDEPNFLRLKAKFYLDRGWQVEQGLRAAWLAEELRPDNAEIKDLVGWGHYLLGDVQVANGKLQEAIRLDPTLPSAHYHLAVLAEAAKQFDIARIEYEKARDLARDTRTRDAAGEALSKLPLAG